MYRLFVNNLTNLDFAYFDHARGLVGETFLASIELSGDLNPDKMLLDFAEVKRYLKNALEELFDHKFVIPTEHPDIQITQEATGLTVSMRDSKGRRYIHQSPPEGVYLAPIHEVTLEQLASLLKDSIKLPVPGLELTLHLEPENITGAYYHYCHGLQQHKGACQRIAHGHRSQIGIFINHQRQPSQEAEWAKKWEDIYIGCDSDLVEVKTEEEVSYHHFRYQASEGEYELQLPSDNVTMLPNSSTIECIAEYLAHTIKASHPNDHVSVKAYEGIGKGTIFEIK